jgi:hypothetical protein
MSQALNTRIAVAFAGFVKHTDAGSFGYMSGHPALKQNRALLQNFYNDRVMLTDTMSVADKTRLAEMLETIAADMEADLQDC